MKLVGIQRVYPQGQLLGECKMSGATGKIHLLVSRLFIRWRAHFAESQ